MLMVAFYWATNERLVTYCMSVWYAGCRYESTPEKITGCPLSRLEDIAHSCYLSRAANIIKDFTHAGF